MTDSYIQLLQRRAALCAELAQVSEQIKAAEDAQHREHTKARDRWIQEMSRTSAEYLPLSQWVKTVVGAE